MKYHPLGKAVDSAGISSPLVTELELANHRLANVGVGIPPSPLTELSALIASAQADNSVTSGNGICQPVVGQSPKLLECDRPRLRYVNYACRSRIPILLPPPPNPSVR